VKPLEQVETNSALESMVIAIMRLTKAGESFAGDNPGAASSHFLWQAGVAQETAKRSALRALTADRAGSWIRSAEKGLAGELARLIINCDEMLVAAAISHDYLQIEQEFALASLRRVLPVARAGEVDAAGPGTGVYPEWLGQKGGRRFCVADDGTELAVTRWPGSREAWFFEVAGITLGSCDSEIMAEEKVISWHAKIFPGKAAAITCSEPDEPSIGTEAQECG
jgi:hypothetical protein